MVRQFVVSPISGHLVRTIKLSTVWMVRSKLQTEMTRLKDHANWLWMRQGQYINIYVGNSQAIFISCHVTLINWKSCWIRITDWLVQPVLKYCKSTSKLCLNVEQLNTIKKDLQLNSTVPSVYLPVIKQGNNHSKHWSKKFQLPISRNCLILFLTSLLIIEQLPL